MKRVIVFIVVLTIIVGILPLGALEAQASETLEYLDGVLTTMVNSKEVKGAIASIIKEDKIILSKGYGYADEKKGIHSDGQDIAFRIGSVSKTFVAIAALKLAEEGKLDMNASVQYYLDDDFPKLKYRITMQDLLTHTGGFEDLISGIAVYDIGDAEPLDQSIRKYIPAQVNKPGQVISYSNYGIALAAYIVESISGMKFYDYCNENIFMPLKMDKTTFKLENENAIISKAYNLKGEEAREQYINLYPEGSVTTTANDMAKYMGWLVNEDNRILSKEYKAKLFEQNFTVSEEFDGIGYVWNRKSRNGINYFEKKGMTANFYSRIIIYPEQKTGVFLSFNNKIQEQELSNILNRLTDSIIGVEKENLYDNAAQTLDISGHYITTVSSFQTLEKILNYLMPSRGFSLKGSLENGFKLNGENLTLIGNNFYSSPLGNLKFKNYENEVFAFTDTANSYIKVSWYENRFLNLIILILFGILSLTVLINNLIMRKQNNQNNKNLLIVFSLMNLFAFVSMFILILVGINKFNILSIHPYTRIMGVLIIFFSTCLLFCKPFEKLDGRHPFIKNIYSSWSIVSVLFFFWMIGVHII